MLAHNRGTASASSLPPQDARKRWNISSSGACIRSCGSRVALSQKCRGTLPAIEAIRADATAQATFQSSDQEISGTRARQKTYDVVTLGNLCVDVMVPVARLPAPDEGSRRILFQELTAEPPPESAWEVGASCNFMIAAARLGLRVGAVGHVGDDVYGDFMRRIMQEEGIADLCPLVPDDVTLPEAMQATLLCFVLVGPHSSHAFCSRYDFGPWPLLEGVTSLPSTVSAVLDDTHALLLNGCVFDELPAELVLSAAQQARANGGAVFFDPGPRSQALMDPSRRAGTEAVIDASDVLLLTQEEAAIISGLQDPEAAGRWVLDRPGAVTRWCLIKLGPGGALLVSRDRDSPLHHNSLKVPVKDTVGCGDSFAAAIVLGFIRGHDLSGVLALANAVGAATAMGVGAGRNVASANTVMSLLRREVSALKGGIEGDVEGIAEGTGRDGDGQSVAEKRELIVGTDVALGDGLTLSTAMKEVAASIDAISVLQMSLDDADN